MNPIILSPHRSLLFRHRPGGLSRTGITAIALLILLVVGGCKTVPDGGQAVACPDLIAGVHKRVGASIEAAKSILEKAECKSLFSQYYQELITIAESDQDVDNPRRFSDFIDWGYQEQKILSRVEAEQLYTEYFSTTFFALPDNVRVCAAAKDIRALTKALKAELIKKQRGLANAAGNSKAYRQAAREMEQVLGIIEGTGTACGDW